MALRRILAEAISHATESSRRQSPTVLYDLTAINRPPGSDEAWLRPRPNEEASVEVERPRQVRAATAETQHGPSSRVRRTDVVAGLASAKSLRRFMVMREILGPPRSISGWDELD